MRLAAAALLFAAAAAVLFHRAREEDIASLVRRVRSASAGEAAASFEARVAVAPPPVRRYLALALGGGSRAPAALELRQAGRLRMTPTSRYWMDFEAVQTVAPSGCAFLWNARVQVAPLVHVRVLDALLAGVGSGEVLLASLVRMAHDGGTPEMNSGSLHRFLAEAVWYPWALVPGDALRWEPIDERRARATLTCHGTSVALEFRFAPGGEVAAIYSDGRWGSFDGRYRKVAWEGHFADYARDGGVLVPRSGEVGWHVGGALQLVWQARVLARAPAR